MCQHRSIETLQVGEREWNFGVVRRLPIEASRGHPSLASLLERAPYAALYGRIQVRVHLNPVIERERFAQLIGHALNPAGCTHTLLSDSAMEQLREASRGVPRQAGRILRNAMRLAVPKGLNHFPDDLLQRAIEEVR